MSRDTASILGRRQAAVNRRRRLLGALACAGVGAGLGWWTYRHSESNAPRQSRLWELEFEVPTGGRLRMKTLLGQPLLVNFWATWCPPCIEEMPLLDSFYTENHPKGWQVLGLAVDQIDSVRRFLARSPVQFPIAITNLEGIDISRGLGNFSGGLPFTAAFAPDGHVAQQKLGPLTRADLTRWVAVM